MGHSVTSDICQNVVYLGEYFGSLLPQDELGEESDGERDENGVLLVPAIDEEFEATTIAKAGWKLSHLGYDQGSKHLGRKNRLYSYRQLTKGEFTCWLINSSEYSNVGYYDWTLIGDSAESAAEFIADSCKAFDLEDLDSVEQWG